MVKRVVFILLGVIVLGIILIRLIAGTHQPSTGTAPHPSSLTTTKTGTNSADEGARFTSDPAEPVTFSTDSLPVTIKQSAASPVSDGQYLLNNVERCGPHDRPGNYYHDLVQSLDKLPKTVYTISEQNTGTTQPAHFVVSLIPNLLGYKNLDAVQADFFMCPGDSGHLKAVQSSDKWLVFVQPCAADDMACKNIEQVVDQSIQLKMTN